MTEKEVVVGGTMAHASANKKQTRNTNINRNKKDIGEAKTHFQQARTLWITLWCVVNNALEEQRILVVKRER